MLLLSVLVIGQPKTTSIDGDVRGASREPLLSIMDIIKEYNNTVTPNLAGKFKIINLEVGSHSLVFSGVEFLHQIKNISLSRSLQGCSTYVTGPDAWASLTVTGFYIWWDRKKKKINGEENLYQRTPLPIKVCYQI